jgi:hypothetical protein
MAAMSQAEKFFYKQYKSRETAQSLARAEAEAERRGWTYDWSFDEDPDISWMTDKQRKEVETGKVEILQVLLRDERGKVLESLGGIVLQGRRNTKDPYARVVEAELAAEALSRKLSNPLRSLFG